MSVRPWNSYNKELRSQAEVDASYKSLKLVFIQNITLAIF